MQSTRSTPKRETAGQFARTMVGIVLLVLVMGIWACLWVPPVPAF